MTETNTLSSLGFTEITDAAALAQEIMENPESWVPILGNGISFDISNDPNSLSKRHRQIQRLARKAALEADTRSQNKTDLFLAAQEGNFNQLEEILFGDSWDGFTFLDANQHKQIRFREEYAKGLMRAEEINIELTKCQVSSPNGSFSYRRTNLTPILEIFPNLILTTCQDETLEAFMEYQKSLPISQNVCTPDAFATSPKWERRLNALLASGSSASAKTASASSGPVLLKLRGTCQKPYRMLFSKRDFKAYYSDSPQNPMAVFLKKLFCQKHLLVLGTDKLTKSQMLCLPPEIEDLWKASKGCQKRYILPGTDADTISRFLQKLLFEYQKLQALTDSGNNEAFPKPDTRTGIPSHNIGVSAPGSDMSAVLSAAEGHTPLHSNAEMESAFWTSYIRRPRTGIPRKEIDFFKREILKTTGPGSLPGYWSPENIRLLAMAANNLADFYDTAKMLVKFLPENETLTPDTMALSLTNMINSRLSDESRMLYCLFSRYGGGFPSGFLELLTNTEEERNRQKKAAIQLSNSGICIKGQQRKNIHSRMHYADNLMLTAKSGLHQQKLVLQNKLRNINRQVNDSYFYVSRDFPQPKDAAVGKTEQMFLSMFHTLTEILKSKSEGYTHFRSLLETETPAILPIIMSPNHKNQTWIPQLIYYLLQEGRMVPLIHSKKPGETSLKEELTRLLSYIDQFDGRPKELQRNKIMIYLALGILESQSRDDRIQEAALLYCEKAMTLLLEQIESTKRPEEFFDLELKIYFSIIRIYGRRSSIKEVERCAKKAPDSPEQNQMLQNMSQYLSSVKNLIGKYKTSYHDCEEAEAQWNQLMGDYYFKMSQYRWENRKYRPAAASTRPASRKDKDYFYEEAQKSYQAALDYYDKYPHRFELQKADVLRSMADILCQDGKSRGCPDDSSPCRIRLEKCCSLLFQAYEIYRKHTNLHGIADVLQSMGNTESYQVFRPDAEERKRSSLCFYKASSELYRSLGDDWSRYIVDAFWEQAKEQREKAYKC